MRYTMKSLLKMTWMEIKLFLREPIEPFSRWSSRLMMLFLFGSIYGNKPEAMFGGHGQWISLCRLYTAMIIATSGLLSISITMAGQREQGILRRLRTTPIHPFVILAAQVIVVFLMTCLAWFY